MKQAIFMMFVMSANAASAIGFDGCFRMYNTGVVGPTFCLDGSAEEGVGGSGARLALFRPNTDQPIHCSRTSSKKVDASRTKVTLEVNDKVEMIIYYGETDARGLRTGEVQMGNTRMKFSEFKTNIAQQLLRNLYSTNLCR